MYSRKSVEAGLKVAEQVLGYEPVYHSIAACDEAAEHFKTKRDRYIDSTGFLPEEAPKGIPRLFYDEEECRWMENEREVCRMDYLYFATRYATIQNAEEEIVHYSPNIAQLIVNDARSQQEDLGWAIMQMWLKGRQCGITTDSQTVVGHRTLFYENVIALTGSSDKERSRDMVDKYKALYESLPYWLVPKMTTQRVGMRMEFAGINSKLVVQHGAQKYDIGRGNTPSCVHLSEVATYLNAADLIDAGLVPAVHESPRKIVILESTGEGPFGWWYDTWNICKALYWKGQAKFRPGFLPWFVASDFYPTDAWLKRSLMLKTKTGSEQIRQEARETLRARGWTPEGTTVAHANRAAKFVRVNRLLRKYYPENWEMPLEQQWFWQVTREEYRKKKILARFQREFAADDLESFCASGESVFDVDTISEYNNNCREPVGVYGFRCDDVKIIPGRLQASESDRDTSRKVIEVGIYQMVPLKWEGYQTSNFDAKLLIFEWPEDGQRYGFGVDTADGIGQDNTVVEGLRMGDLERNDRQVCELASGYINAEDLAPIVHCIAMFYQGASTRQPKIAIETGLNGELTQLKLRMFGWSNFHLWVRYDRKKLDQNASRIGFVTNRWSRPMLIDLLVKALRDGEIDIDSPEFVREMQALHRDENVQAMRAETGQKDDRFMALGIIYLSLHILEYTGRAPRLNYLRQKRLQEGPSLYRDLQLGAGDEVAPETNTGARGENRLAQYFGTEYSVSYSEEMEADL